jgi:hypothetical protein
MTPVEQLYFICFPDLFQFESSNKICFIERKVRKSKNKQVIKKASKQKQKVNKKSRANKKI